MIQPVLIGLSPNAERDDVRLACKVLLQPWKWRHGNAVVELEGALSRFFNARPTVATSSGRAALYYTLRAFGIGKNDEVIVQAFTCVSVPAAVAWTGATPVYCDITPDTYTMSVASLQQRITPQSRAIIVQHTFGVPADLTEVLKVARQHNLIVIEDCAHALGGTYHGQPLGTLADAAVVSFGRDKSISSVFGGAVVFKSPAVAARMRATIDKLPLPSLVWVKQQLLHPILFSLVKPLYFRWRAGQLLLVLFQKLHIVSKAVTRKERDGAQPSHVHTRLSPGLATLALHQLQKVQRFTAQRGVAVQRYRTAGLHSTVLLQHSEKISWLRYPLRVQDRSRLMRVAKAQGVLLGDWYPAPVFPVTSARLVRYTAGSCPAAEAAAAAVINLPTYPGLTAAQIEKVIRIVRPYLTPKP